MRLQFNIHFPTQWGEILRLVILGTNLPNPLSGIFDMECSKDFRWTRQLDLSDEHTFIEYQYVLETKQGAQLREFGKPRKLMLLSAYNDIYIHDTWRLAHGDSPFETAVFRQNFFNRKIKSEPVTDKSWDIQLQLYAPQIEPDRHFAVTGNQNVLGNWDVSHKITMNESDFPVWSLKLNSKDLRFPIEYKFLIVDTPTNEVLAWGGGPNRRIEKAHHGALNIFNEEHFIRTIPSWKAAGVAIPVFSLRSRKSMGTGEFYDLKLMIDWAKATGQKMIQILPINDTILYHSNYDSYPYNAVSVYALHPVYLHPEAVGKIKDKSRKAYFAAKRKKLNAKSFSDYQNVMKVKWEYFREIYPDYAPKVFKSDEYKTFFSENREWLVPYAVFSWLRDKYGTPEFALWPEYQIYNPEEVELLALQTAPHYHEIAIFYFLQFHLNKQLKEVHAYARQQGVCIKGDIPIGVSPRSVDAWVEPHLFNTAMQAGAPPDDFSVTGQNWGFPTYNWDLMHKDNYQWWKKRFRKLAEYFDAYRIDHILGFFRIWEIPGDDVWGLTGSFNPSLPYSVDELKQRGLQWDEDRFLRPYLKEHVLQSIFGKYTEEVLREYFDQDGWQTYLFKPVYDTQKKVEKHFAALGYNFGTKEVLVRDGLYMLHCEVLFLRDSRNPAKVHPRISMHSSATFRDLNDETRRILDGIYVDYFYHRHNEFWKQQAYKKLPALINSTNMLVCGEDLGMVPDSVPEVMNKLEILSLEIQRMPKKPNIEFAMPADAPYLSVCTTSTHDMNPIRAWWLEDANITQRFYNRALGIQGPAPEICKPWIAERIVRQHLDSKAMWVILPWQDWMSVDAVLSHESPTAERINVPSNPRNFWCYRMHMTLEDLLKASSFNQRIKSMIEECGR